MANISKQPYGKLGPAAQEASLYTLKAAQGMELQITDYGGIITRWRVPDRQGCLTDIVLGFDHLEDYLGAHPYFGALIGRFANRIDCGRFVLDTQSYQLAAQDAAGNHLHGGVCGFDKQLWHSAAGGADKAVCLRLQHLSPHGDEGYPGNLEVAVCYTLYDDNRLQIEYRATTDRPTIVNLTNHSYFNLGGGLSKASGGDIRNHEIQIAAERYVAVDERQIPTGELVLLEGSPLDCRQLTNMGQMFARAAGAVVDHCYVLGEAAGARRLAAVVEAPETGIRLRFSTDNVGVQFYNANKLGGITGRGGVSYGHFGGFCLESQCFPDTPNRPDFPSCVLRPGQEYRHWAEFCLECC